MKGLDLRSPLDGKARDVAVAYFDLEIRTIANAAELLGIKRDTVSSRLARADRNGWVTIYASPMKAGPKTLPRVCGRRVFWVEDVWSTASESSAAAL